MENIEPRICRHCKKEMEGERDFTLYCPDCYKGIIDDSEYCDNEQD